MARERAVADRKRQKTKTSEAPAGPDLTPSIAIIGAGFGGLCSAIRLKQEGFTKLSVFDKADRVGGTWHYNTYPGCAVDVPVQLYSFSFEPNAEWNYVYARNEEIQTYCEHVTDKFGVRPHLKLGVEVKSAEWIASRAKWKLTFSEGPPLEFDVLISSVGQLNTPRFPEIEGRDAFAGESFHSARWNHAVDLKGKRVGVIGNAASAVQFIPEIAKDISSKDNGRLTIFQRTPNYLLPRRDRAFSKSEKWLFRHAPWLMKLGRNRIYWWAEWMFWGAFNPKDWRSRLFTFVSLKHLEKQVTDPHLRGKLTPNYPIGCKRIIFSDDYYPTLNEPNVHLVTDPIARVTPEGVETKDGAVHALDVLIYGTGFETSDFNWSVDITGRDGVKLKESWKTGPEAYLGITVAGFPNMFLTYGPNTNLGHNSIIYMIEQQVNYIVQCVQRMDTGNIGLMEVRRVAQEDFNRTLQAALGQTSWAGDCGSWYKNAAGKITNNWMGSTREYRRATLHPEFGDYEVHPRVDTGINRVTAETASAESPAEAAP